MSKNFLFFKYVQGHTMYLQLPFKSSWLVYMHGTLKLGWSILNQRKRDRRELEGHTYVTADGTFTGAKYKTSLLDIGTIHSD